MAALSLACVATLLALLAIGAAADKLYYVASDDTADCPVNEVCFTLSYYVDHREEYFENDAMTTFRLLKGEHILNHTTLLTINNVSEFTLQSSSLDYVPLITCIGNETGIAIVNSRDIIIENLAISNCGGFLNRSINSTKLFCDKLHVDTCRAVSLAIVNVTNTILRGLNITNGSNTGLLVFNGNNITVTSSVFSGHHPNMMSVFAPLSTCNDSTGIPNITMSLSDSHFIGGSLDTILLQGCSYRVITMLDSIVAHGSQDNNINFYIITDSAAYSIQANNVNSTGANGIGINIEIHDEGIHEMCCDMYMDPNPCLITIERSQFSDHANGGMQLYLDSDTEACQTVVSLESCTISNNRGQYAGMKVLQSLPSVNCVTLRNSTFQDNQPLTSAYSSAIAIYSTIVTFDNVTVRNTSEYGILCFSSVIAFKNSNYITFNKHGGIGLLENSQIHLLNTTAAVHFINNTGDLGGAIYLGQSQFLFSSCFVVVGPRDTDFKRGGLFFENNRAKIANDIYGVKNGTCSAVPMNVFDPSLNLLSLSSPPVGVCVCDNSSTMVLDCDTNTKSFAVSPGEEIQIYVIPVGFGSCGSFAPTQGALKAVSLTGNETCIWQSSIISSCTLWQYKTEMTNLSEPSIEFNITNDQQLASIHEVRINISFTMCPVGFQLQGGVCQCNSFLTKVAGNLITCDVTSRTIERRGGYWIGLSTSDLGQGGDCIAARTSCPLDYCNTDAVTISLRTNDTGTSQCALNRAYLLCGSCAKNLSLMLGSNRCGECKNINLLLIIPFAVAGFLLVAFLFLLNMTVSMGTINGLIFYANVIKLCEVLFLPHGSVPVVTQFIAWINLDFGFEICFFNGLNQLYKSFLQFVFPFYIWSIILFIFLISRFSGRISRLIGNNAVPVLATLILLSYTKLFRIIGTALQFVTVQLDADSGCSKSYELAWHSQPTLLYVSSMHGYLFACAMLVLLALAVPYTALLLFGHHTRKFLAKCGCIRTWIRLKPFLDAYDAPYREGYRCWTALFLMLRVLINVMLLVADDVILTVIISITAGVLGLSAALKGVYMSSYVNALESWFLINLIMVSSAGFYGNKKSQIVTVISVSLVMLTFLGIVLWHIYLRLSQRTCFANFIEHLNMKFKVRNKFHHIQRESAWDSFFRTVTHVRRPVHVVGHVHVEGDIDDSDVATLQSDDTNENGVRMRRESLLDENELEFHSSDYQADFHLMQDVDARHSALTSVSININQL